VATVVLVGTLDTKGIEYGFLRDRLREAGVDVLLVDAGVMGEPLVEPDVAREEVARAGGVDHAELVRVADRGAAVDAMGRGAAAVLMRLHGEGRLDGTAAVGGSGNSSIAAQAMRDLPVGVPKLIVSTVASGDTRPYVGAVDVTMMYSVVDISGINQISAQILTNAAGAIAGMAMATVPERSGERPLIGATMFGVTTPCVTRARERLEELGYEVLVFHATGTGGQSFEGWRPGATWSARSTSRPPSWPTTSSAACCRRVPIGSRRSGGRGSRRWSRSARWTWSTSAEENAELGRRIARKLNAASSATVLFVPLNGVSAIDVDGQPFRDAAADEALFGALREGIDTSKVEVHEVDADVNDPAFATAMADRLDELVREARS